ncbi:MAG: protease-like activity factor CPAF [Waddliaceae bacterium]
MCNSLFIFIFLPFLLFGSDFKRQKMVNDLEVVRAIFSTKYAPANWKHAYCSWDLDEQIENAQIEIANKPELTTKEYQRIVKGFFNSTQDYHVKCIFYSTEFSCLPLRIQGGSGKYYVVWVDPTCKKKLSSSGLRKGVEVLSFGGKPIQEVIDQLREEEFGQPNSLTDQALAEAFLTFRSGALGHQIPKGKVAIGTRDPVKGKELNVKMEWEYFPEQFPSAFKESENFLSLSKAPLLNFQKRAVRTKNHLMFERKMSTPLNQFARGKVKKMVTPPLIEKEIDDDGPGIPIGSRKGCLPSLGTKIWESSSESTFHAYIFKGENDQTFGYIRIPTYEVDEELGHYKVAEFAQLIALLEEETSALVIDQMSNGGGDYFYLMALVSMLSETTIKLPQERLTLTQEDVAFALEYSQFLRLLKSDAQVQALFGDSLSGYPVNLNFTNGLLNYCDFILSEWVAGRTLTNLTYTFGISEVEPSKLACYTKPIMILVDPLDFSCADFFPAIMQDNQRALIVGTQTAGAGGSVEEHLFPNVFGIELFTYTSSIAERDNKDPIENVGITPDVVLNVTGRDLSENYIEYIDALHRELNGLVTHTK